MGGRRPKWVTEDVHKEMMNILVTDKKHMERSEQNKINRRGGSIDNPIEPTHYQGSIYALQHAKKLAAKNHGKLPEAPDLFLHIHFKEIPGKGRVPTNKKAKEIADNYKQIQHQSQLSSDGTQKSANEMFYEATGGRNNKGRVRGLGKGAELYYATPTSGRGSGSSSQCAPSLMTQMQEQMREELRSELRAEMRVEMQAEMIEMQRKNQEFLDEMMLKFSGMNTPYSCSNVQPQPRDPRNDDSGSGGAG